MTSGRNTVSTVPATTAYPPIMVFERTGVAGHITKEPADIARVLADFGMWLDDGEDISDVYGFTAVPCLDAAGPAWQADYSLCCCQPPAPPGPDTTPLYVTHHEILGQQQVSVLVASGTPGWSYLVSYIAVGDTSGRRKHVNFAVSVAATPCTEEIVVDPDTCISVVTETAVLLDDVCNTILVENATAADITVTLPPAPWVGRTLRCVDAQGDASSYRIRWVASGGLTIARHDHYDFETDFQAADFKWVGDEWVVL